MLKKSMPLFLIVGIVLGGCMNNGAIPKKNETPMQDVEERPRDDWTPNGREENRSGPDVDGIDQREEPGTNRNREGIINEGNVDTNQDMFQNENTPGRDVLEDDLKRRDADKNNR